MKNRKARFDSATQHRRQCAARWLRDVLPTVRRAGNRIVPLWSGTSYMAYTPAGASRVPLVFHRFDYNGKLTSEDAA